MEKLTLFETKKTLSLGGKIKNLSSPLVMGILNITPDSFFDGGQYLSTLAATKQAERMIVEGADIIDLGAASTRPGAQLTNTGEECKRLLPVIQEISRNFPEAILSVDTYNSETAARTVDAGACMINDVSAGLFDSHMFKTIAVLNVPYIMMHMKGTPNTMQQNPVYKDIFKEISSFFSQRLIILKDLGVNDIIIDPGFGFGKTLDQNYELLNLLPYFKIFEEPLLVGVSRKSMACKLLEITPQEALNATTCLNTLALAKGANLLRVHDVLEARQSIKIVEKLQAQGQNE